KTRRIRIVDITRALSDGRRASAMEHNRRNARARRTTNRSDDVRHFTRSKNGIDLRNFRAQLVAIPLGETPRDDEAAARAVLLVLRHLENGVDRLLLGRVDERARVD